MMTRNAKKTIWSDMLPNFLGVLLMTLLMNYLSENWLLMMLFYMNVMGIIGAILYFGGMCFYLSFMQGDLRDLRKAWREKRADILDFLPISLMLIIPLIFGFAMQLPFIGVLYTVTSLLWSVFVISKENR